MTAEPTKTYEATLESLLRHRVSEKKKIFVPYITAGLPSPQRFVDLVSELSGPADALEVGIPFSDPIMDGPIIQEASTRALQAGVTVGGALQMIRESLRQAWVPVVVMTYYNPIHKAGEGWLDALASAGVQGLIVPDLPYEEAGDLDASLKGRGIALVQMVGPTTPDDRAATLARASRGFIYAVSRLGVTGERDSLDVRAREVVGKVRPHTDLPVLLGIGISNPRQAAEAAAEADGVIVGSAIMKKVLGGDPSGAAALGKEIRKVLDQGR